MHFMIEEYMVRVSVSIFVSFVRVSRFGVIIRFSSGYSNCVFACVYTNASELQHRTDT